MRATELFEKYIRNESVLRNAEMLHEMERENIYGMTYPQFDNSLGYIEYSSLRVEKAVVDVIELEEYHELEYQEHYRTRKLLHESLKVLNNEELEAYNAVVWNCPSDLSKQELIKLGNRAHEKICNFIAKNHLKGVRKWKELVI